MVAFRHSVQKFVLRSRVRIFRNECTRSTPLDPKLTFWCVSYYLGAFGTVWLPCDSRCKTGRTSAKVRATKSRRISQQTHTIHPIGTKTHIFVHFVLFACIRDHLVALQNMVQNFPNSCKSLCHEVTSDFLQRTHPIHPIGQ